MDVKDYPGITDEKNLVAPCGNFCGACDMYRCAAHGNRAGQEKLAERFRKHLGMPDAQTEWMVCVPCRQNLEKCWSADCKVFHCCVKEKGLDFCFECDDFPCDLLKPCSGCAPAHNLKVFNLVRIQKLGWKKWLEEATADPRELHARYFNDPLKK
mgnify:FL=1